MAELICPKCQSSMRSYERSGVTVDQCTGCQGLFLDKGELERLTQAEDIHMSRGGNAMPGGQPGGGYPAGGGFLGTLFGGGHERRSGGHHGGGHH